MNKRNKNKKYFSLNVKNNKLNNSNSIMIITSQDEKEKKFEIIGEGQINQIGKYINKERDCINDKEIKSLIINSEFDFKYDTSLKQILPVGLKNVGNSCFMNCCLQCFYHCSNFTSELLENYQRFEKMKCPVLLCYLDALKKLYTNGKESSKKQIIFLSGDDDNDNDNEFESEDVCCCKKRKIMKKVKAFYYQNETNPASAKELYKYILNNYSNVLYNKGSDPKIVAEMILSTMNKEIDSNFKYIRDNKIPKNDETLLFNHIYNYYEDNKTIVSSNFYWIKEKINICNECGKETYNFQSEYILYFYPETIINGLNLKIDNNNKYKLSLENCFEYFHTSEQLNENAFTCKVCNKRVKAKSILNYMATLPKYLVLCICKDKDESNQINYIFDYNQEIDLARYYRKHPQNNYSTKYKFHCGCYSRSDYFHMIAYCVHFDGAIYEFNDSFYQKYDLESKGINKFKYPYLLIYRRDDVNI